VITVRGKKLILSKRKASDVLALIDYCKSIDLPEKMDNLSADQIKNYSLMTSQTVADSLKATYMNLQVKRFWFVRKYFAKKYKPFLENGAKYLLDNCDSQTIGEAFAQVVQLDNIKKKVMLEKKASPSLMELGKVS
jgi:plasmid replication initiation protein